MGDNADRPGHVLFDFTDPETVRLFRSINDGVMGGVSTGSLVAREGEGAVFRGIVSFDNNGGFASVRSVPGEFRLAGHQGFTLRVKGDGKTYKILLKTSAALDGVQYQARFQPPPAVWKWLSIPFSSFVPAFRGRVLTDGDPLDPARVVTVGLMISDRQEGPFSLTLSSVSVYR